MPDLLSALLGFLAGLFGILLGLAYFLPLVLVAVAIGAYLYLRFRRGRPHAFSAREPGRRRKR